MVVDEITEFDTADAYLPMLRLAESMDRDYVSANAGPAQAAKYRRGQRKFLKEYLKGMERDFHRMHAMAASSPGPNATVDDKMRFILSMWNAELRLFFSAIIPFAVDLKPLVAHMAEVAKRAREASRQRVEFRVS